METDLRAPWRPYTQHQTAREPLSIVRAEGAYLYTENETYLDANSSWWTTLHGHSHPHIAQAIAHQAATLDHVQFGDCIHSPAETLSQRLTELLPHTSHVFFSDNGSTAVETALKIAIQYWHNRDEPRTKVLALKGGYHGDTFGAMSVSEPGRFTEPFFPMLFDVDFITTEILEDAACFIFEPVVQGVNGMALYDPKALSHLIALCRENGIITIADEVMTGFGRTGPLFASDYLDDKPDMICLSKAITGGTLPLAATLCTEKLFEEFLSEDRAKAFLHGHTYCANPIGCAAANASLDLLLTDECTNRRTSIAEQHKTFLEEWGEHPSLKSSHSIGTILNLEYQGETTYFNTLRDRLFDHFLSRNILLRPLGNTIHIMPPYCITESELEEIYRAIIETLSNTPS